MKDQEQEIEVDPALRIPTRVEIHTKEVENANLKIYADFLKDKGLPFGVFKTLSDQAEVFEVEFYNKEDQLIDVLVCPYEAPPVKEE